MWRMLVVLGFIALTSGEPLRFQPHGGAPGNVICPDKMGTCPTGSTCCKLVSGRYGCCSFPQATCCSDHQHCCPHDFKCDIAAGMCTLGDKSVPMATKTDAIPVDETLGDTLCPGKKTYCPGSSTCCKLASGNYGCCPFAKAVCCSDKTHCCPDGYTCSSGRCVDGKNQNNWFTLSQTQPAAPAGSSKNQASSPPATLKAPPQAVNTVKLQRLARKKKNMCPGGKTFCDHGRTCCYKDNGHFGCCSFINGTCCSDRKHCCPLGFSCDIKLGKCTKEGGLTLPWGETDEPKSPHEEPEAKTPPSDNDDDVQYVVCPDGQSQCADGTTCCLLLSGEYGCCPLAHAVCCSDHLHCCPQGTTCDVGAGTCTGMAQPMVKSIPSRKVWESLGEKQTICGDKVSTCPDSFTCCVQPTGEYKCCPMPSAHCCTDHLHCCPGTMMCNITAGLCIPLSTPWVEKIPAKPVHPPPQLIVDPPEPDEIPHVQPLGNAIPDLQAEEEDGKICKDNKTTCDDGTTCCLMLDGYYACCPFPDAVCCPDKLHCCQKGETCDIAKGECHNPRGVRLPWEDKHRHTPPAPAANALCPDHQSQCPSGSTCCSNGQGGYGCCPLPQAVCCSDFVHCCPNGYTCNTGAGTCTREGLSIPWHTKTPAVGNVVCPDHKSQCPTGSTCCDNGKGSYGCCPTTQAVCCSDHIHCCPSGYTCDISAGKCNREGLAIPWHTKTDANAVNEELPQPSVERKQCPDKRSSCPNSATCCLLTSGQYGCCPLPKAVCCQDHTHCCPQSYTCDTTTGACLKGVESIPWVEKTPAEMEPSLERVQCPDKRSSCPNSATCCLLTSGQYGCCPLPKAVCCQDHTHCCPQSYTCDTSKGACLKGVESIPWVEKTPAEPFQAEIVPAKSSVGYVVCPDKTSQCQDGYTCCMMPSKTYGCCPIPHAVCCSDGRHCCPSDTTCDTTTMTCKFSDNSLEISWSLVRRTLNFVAAQPEDRLTKTCKDQTQCPQGSTCCMMTSGKYGCCPYANAACCSDKVHCCPQGFTCSSSGKSCDKADSSLSITSTQFTRFKALPPGGDNSVCPGGKASCPADQTCCLLKDKKEFGCCPFPNAVCCSDGTHCCPQGYACDPQSGTCTQAVPWMNKIPAIPRQPALQQQQPALPEETVERVVCPGGQYTCPDASTCCALASGGYGCCPSPQATCCSDHASCCPNGYKCAPDHKCVRQGDPESATAALFISIATSRVSNDERLP